MLVLTRKLNEQIKIGDNITITVIKLRNNQIRLGIEAPRDVRVLRGELAENIAADAGSNSAEDEKTGATLSNRVRSFLSVASQSEHDASNNSHQRTRNDVVDGLMSAAEMIAAGQENRDEDHDGELPASQNEDAPKPSLQVFSGKIGSDGAIRENTPSRVVAARGRAPLAGYFTAP